MTARDVTHQVKIDRHWWTEIREGRKTAELRLDDRDYQIGDKLRFVISGNEYPSGERTITHVLKNAETFGLRTGYVMLSLNDPDDDYYRERYETFRDLWQRTEHRVRAFKGALTKQRRKYDALMDRYRLAMDTIIDLRTELRAYERGEK